MILTSSDRLNGLTDYFDSLRQYQARQDFFPGRSGVVTDYMPSVVVDISIC
jgi:hypothetical protein